MTSTANNVAANLQPPVQVSQEAGNIVTATAAGAAAVAVAAGAQSLHHRLVTVPKEARQEEVRDMVERHLGHNSYYDISGDYVRLPLKSPHGVCQHIHLQTAFEILNSYLTKLSGSRTARDPRTRRIITSLLHAWFREHVGRESLHESDVKGVADLCRDIMYRPTLFVHGSLQRRTFGLKLMDFRKMIAEVYQHLQWQLGEVLSEEKSCARICRLIFVLFNNNVEVGVVQYLLQAATSWTGLDNLPSHQVSILYRSLPTTTAKEDVRLRKEMKPHWATDVGTLMAFLLHISPNVSINALPRGGSRTSQGGSFAESLEEVKAKWSRGDLHSSGLAGFMQEQQILCLKDGSLKLAEPLENYLDCMQLLYDLIYMQKDVFTKFVEISNAFGDYGSCRVQPLLHPFLSIMSKKCKSLADKLQQLHNDFEEYVVRARNLGLRVVKPLPSDKMSRNADEAFHRVVKGEGAKPSHFSYLQQQVRLLEDSSSQDRLPELKKAMKGLMNDLLEIFNSHDYRRCAGTDFVQPPSAGLLEAESQQSEVLQNALEGVGLDEGMYVDDLVAEQDLSHSPARPPAASDVPKASSDIGYDRPAALCRAARTHAATDPDLHVAARQSVRWKWNDACLSATCWSPRQTLDQLAVSFDQHLVTRDAQRPIKLSFEDTDRSMALMCVMNVSSAADILAETAVVDDTPPTMVLSTQFLGKAVAARWMWGDPGLTKVIPSYRHIARRIPWRWSRPRGVEATITDLEIHLATKVDRPVRLEVWTVELGGKGMTYSVTTPSISAAVNDLRRFSECNKVAGPKEGAGMNRRTACLPPSTKRVSFTSSADSLVFSFDSGSLTLEDNKTAFLHPSRFSMPDHVLQSVAGSENEFASEMHGAEAFNFSSQESVCMPCGGPYAIVALPHNSRSVCMPGELLKPPGTGAPEEAIGGLNLSGLLNSLVTHHSDGAAAISSPLPVERESIRWTARNI